MAELDLNAQDDAESVRLLADAIIRAVQGEMTWLIRDGRRVAAIVPPQVAAAGQQQLAENQRLSEIATGAAGLPPESARLPRPGETVIMRPGQPPEEQR
jgi:hypothetical protein